MSLHEAMARSRQREAEEYRLVRRLTAGRLWARLGGYATRRARRSTQLPAAGASSANSSGCQCPTIPRSGTLASS